MQIFRQRSSWQPAAILRPIWRQAMQDLAAMAAAVSTNK